VATLAERIITALSGANRALDDDELARRVGASRRQAVNQTCRALEQRGALYRHPGPQGKIVNALIAREATSRGRPNAPAVFMPAHDAGTLTRARWAPILDRDNGDAAILLLGCGKSKLDHPAPAAELYVGPVFRARRAYAEATGERWYVLSAKYGLLDPEEMIAPYDVCLARQPVSYRRAWAEQVTEQLTVELGILSERQFELHAGAAFTQPLSVTLPARGAIVSSPLAGHNQGQTIAWYRAARTEGETRNARPQR
jgi:hypothetical protein